MNAEFRPPDKGTVFKPETANSISSTLATSRFFAPTPSPGLEKDTPPKYMLRFRHGRRLSSCGMWAVSVSGNRRITFQFEGEDAIVVDYEDYH